jgi:predicted lipid-binding transport protein (Tim44 family)
MKLLSTVLVLVLALAASHGWAKRLTGGVPANQPSSEIDRSSHLKSNPTAQTAASSTAPPNKPWGAILAGLAAGLGLAWLSSSLGWSEGAATVVLILVTAAFIATIVFFVRRRRAQAFPASSLPNSDVAYQGAAGVTPRSYSPQNVGNDASARPWERSTTNFESSRYSDIIKPSSSNGLMAAGLAVSATAGIPPGFDAEAFLRASKTNFIELQAAWDRADIPSLRAMMTDGMLSQIKLQLADRERQQPHTGNLTDVVMLEARLLAIEDVEHEYIASVEFSGLIREDLSVGPGPFREVWNITRSKSGQAGWLVAAVQALQ